MSTPNVVIEMDGGEVRDVYADTAVNVAFIDRCDVNPEAPNFMDAILGSPAMVKGVYDATVTTDDIHGLWKQMQDMEIPEDVPISAPDTDD